MCFHMSCTVHGSNASVDFVGGELNYKSVLATLSKRYRIRVSMWSGRDCVKIRHFEEKT